MYESEDKMVSHPAHYLKGGMETIDVIEAFTEGLSGIEAYDTGAIIKYICRWKDKGGKQDLEKAMWYTQHLIDHINTGDDDINTGVGIITADDAWASLGAFISNLLQVAGELSDRLKEVFTEGVCRLYGCESDPDGFCYRGEGALSNREFKVVAHAMWKYNVDPAVSDSPFICSSCLSGSEYDSQFCPHCGATMDGVVE